MHTIIFLIVFIIAYLAVGIYSVRGHTGGWIAMIDYNYPKLGLALMFGIIFLWPVWYLLLGSGFLYIKVQRSWS